MGGWVRNTENKAQLRPARAGALSELGNSNPSIITNKDEFKIDVRNIAIELMENWHGRAAFQHSEFGRWTAGHYFFQTPSTFLGPPCGHFGFCRRCGVAGGEEQTDEQTDRRTDQQTDRRVLKLLGRAQRMETLVKDYKIMTVTSDMQEYQRAFHTSKIISIF